VRDKNIRMAQDLVVGKWNLVSLNDATPESGAVDVVIDDDNDEIKTNDGGGGGYFVVTLRAQDTNRIATIGTLMRVIHTEDNYSLGNRQTLSRIVVKCQAVGIVEVQGVETGLSEEDYSIGHVTFLEIGDELRERSNNQYDRYGTCTQDVVVNGAAPNGTIQPTNKVYQPTAIDTTPVVLEDSIIKLIVRSMYLHPTNGIASRELPIWAQDILVDNLPPFTPEDFTSRTKFWNVVECWQMLCNTVREARRSDLQTDLNELMIKAACEKGGPLTLPVKREGLPVDVQATLVRMEREANDDFLSLGMDPCLDFQALLGMSSSLLLFATCNDDVGVAQSEGTTTGDGIHAKRMLFLSDMIRKEKERLETKEKLKAMFNNDGDERREVSGNSFQ